jgi:hypothetical protein
VFFDKVQGEESPESQREEYALRRRRVVGKGRLIGFGGKLSTAPWMQTTFFSLRVLGMSDEEATEFAGLGNTARRIAVLSISSLRKTNVMLQKRPCEAISTLEMNS